MQRQKKLEIRQQIDFIFNKFEFDEHGKESIKTAHKLLKAFEQNKDIKFYDIDEDFKNKTVTINIHYRDGDKTKYLVHDDGK